MDNFGQVLPLRFVERRVELGAWAQTALTIPEIPPIMFMSCYIAAAVDRGGGVQIHKGACP